MTLGADKKLRLNDGGKPWDVRIPSNLAPVSSSSSTAFSRHINFQEALRNLRSIARRYYAIKLESMLHWYLAALFGLSSRVSSSSSKNRYTLFIILATVRIFMSCLRTLTLRNSKKVSLFTWRRFLSIFSHLFSQSSLPDLLRVTS